MDGGGAALSRYDKTNQTLLETIEGRHARIDQNGLAQLLDRNHKRLVENLSAYKPSSSVSLDKVKAGKVEIGGKPQSINASERDFVVKLSKRLDLDALEALKIFRNFMKYEATGRFEYDAEASTREVMRHYYRERQALLKCISALFRLSLTDQTNAAVDEARQRLEDPKNKLDRRMLDMFVTLSDEPVPKQRLETRQDQEAWAKNNLEEQSLCLEILFLIHYNKDPAFEPELILSYAQFLKKHVVWNRIHPLLGEDSRPLMNRICAQCVLILLLLFGLETISENGDETPGRATKMPAGEIRQRFEKEFEQWAYNPAHGPLLLAWACVSQFKFNGNPFLRRARDLEVVPFLSALTAVFDPNYPLLAGYKSVIAGELGAALTCFDVSAVGEFDQLLQLYHDVFYNEPGVTLPFLKSNFHKKSNALYQISCSSFPHEFDPFVRLSQSFAADSITAQFTFQNILNMERFTIARSELPPNMECATIMPSPGQPGLELLMTLCPIHLPGLVIPPETRGRVHRVDDDEIIQWNVKYSGWTYFMGKIAVLAAKLSNRQHTTTTEIVQVTLILRLMNQVFAKNEALVGSLNRHLKEVLGRNTNLLRQLFTLLRTASNLAASSPALLEMLNACVRCINRFASSHPLQVWEEMRRGGVLQEMSSSIKGKPDGDIRQILVLEQRNGLYPITISFLNLLYTLLSYARKWQLPGAQEDMTEDYEEDVDSVSLEDFHPCLSFIKADLFARYESWRYQKSHQKHKIGIKIMNIFIDILSEDTTKGFAGQALSTMNADTNLPMASPMGKYKPMTPAGTPGRPLLGGTPMRSPARGTVEYRQAALTGKRARHASLKESLLASLLDDRSFHKVLLKTAAIGLPQLERLKDTEGETLRRLVLKSLNILERVLQSKETLQANNAIASTTSSLEHFLLSMETTVSANALYAQEDIPDKMRGLTGREAKEVHVIAVIANYINASKTKDRSIDLPLYATKLLSLLCGIRLDSGFAATGARPPSLVGYLGTQAEAVRDAYMTKLNDPLTNENLRVVILQLVEKALRHQPGLALLFINIDANKAKKNDDGENVQESHSCLKIVRKMLANSRHNIHSLPRLFAEVMSLLASLWRAAPSHQSIIRALRESSDFWKHLTETLCASIERHLHAYNVRQAALSPAKSPSGSAGKGKDKLDDLDDEAGTAGDVCYQVAIGANVLQILAQEVFHVDDVSDQLDASLRDQLKLLASKEKQDKWFGDIATHHYDRKLFEELREQVKVLARTLSHKDVSAAVATPGRAETSVQTTEMLQSAIDSFLPITEGDRDYGVDYYYNASLLQNKLSDILELQTTAGDISATPARMKRSDFDALGFLRTVHTVNNMYSMLEVQQELLHSWRSFLEITSLKQTASSVLAVPQASASLIQQLAAALQREDKRGKAIEQRMQEMASLLLFLLKHHYARIKGGQASSKGKEKEGDELFPAANVALALKEALLRRSLTSDIDVPFTASLLGSLLVLLRANHKPESTQALSDAVLPLLPQAFQLVQRPEFNHTVIAILEALTLKTQDKTRLYDHLQHLGVYGKLVEILHRSLHLEESETSTAIATLSEADSAQVVQTVRNKQKTAELVLHLMLSMSADPIMTETLALAGVMRVLSNNTLRAFQEMHLTYANGKRSAWHRLWCLILTLTTAIVRTLTHSETLVEQAIEFLAIHNVLVSRSIDVPNAPYTLAQLNEAERVTSLIYELGLHWKKWRFLHGKLAIHYQDRILGLVYNLVVALQSGQMSAFAQPVTKKQKMLAQPIALGSTGRNKDKESAATDAAAAAEADAPQKSKNEAPEVRPFHVVVAHRMHHILRNCLSFLRAVGPQLSPAFLANPDDRLQQIDWDAYRPLFEADLFFQAPSLPLAPKRMGLREDDDMLVDEAEENLRGLFSTPFTEPPRPTLGLLIKGILQVCASGIKEGVFREGPPQQLLVYTVSLVDKLTGVTGRGTSRGDSAATRSLYQALKKVSLQLQEQHRVLYDCMQVALYMLLSHLVIYIRGKQPISDSAKVNLGMEMESFFGRLVRDLKHKQERGDVAEQVPAEVVEDYIAFFGRTKSYFEQLLNTWAASQTGSYGPMGRRW